MIKECTYCEGHGILYKGRTPVYCKKCNGKGYLEERMTNEELENKLKELEDKVDYLKEIVENQIGLM